MRFFASALLLAASLVSTSLAGPLPYELSDIERRWAEGLSESKIHLGQTHRDMTPAWQVVRNEPGGGFTLDERTMQTRGAAVRDGLRKRETDGANASLVEQIKATMVRFLGMKDVERRVAESAEEDSVPVLKPRKAFRYSFTA